MNLALASLIIFLILAPGIILLRSYFSFPFSKNYISSSTISDLAIAILPGIAIQLIWMWVASWFNYSVEVGIVASILVTDDSKVVNEAFSEIQKMIVPISWYNLTIWIFSYGLGFIFRTIVILLEWDTSWRVLRFNNEWYYLLTGRILNFNHISHAPINKINFVFVDVVISLAEGDYIYVGLLQEYQLAPDGKLESFTLKDVKRRKVSKDATEQDPVERYYKIPSSFFVVPQTEIKNINIRYLELPTDVQEVG